MRSRSLRMQGGGWMAWILGAACGALLWPVCPAMAQTSLPGTAAPSPRDLPWPSGPAASINPTGLGAPTPPVAKADPPQASPATATTDAATRDDGLVQASCSSCGGGGGLLGAASAPFGGGCSSCGGCGDGQCVAGRLHECSCCMADTCCGKILCGIYNCVCCPDPCYEPHWNILTDAAFFVDAARPITQMVLRWDETFGIPRPDRAEYWVAQEGTKGPPKGITSINEEQLSLYNEVAVSKFSFFVEIPYKEVDLNGLPGVADGTGFGDMNLGTKSLLLDCELLEIAFQFKTYIPIGKQSTGVSNGHVSLEPALLFALKLAAETYLQAEVAYWIPLDDANMVESDVFHAHLSLNQLLWRILPDVQLVGTAELSEWSVIGGNFTLPDGTLANGTGNMVNGGFGVRLNICDKIDFGIGTQFYLTGNKWEDNEFKAEFRWRF